MDTTKILDEPQNKLFFSMACIFVHEMRTSVSTGIIPGVRQLLERDSKDSLAQDLMHSAHLLQALCEATQVLTTITRDYPQSAVRSSMLQTSLFSATPDPDAMAALLRDAVARRWQDDIAFETELSESLRLSDMYTTEGIFATKVFYEVLFFHLLEELRKYSRMIEGKIRLKVEFQPKKVTFKAIKLSTLPERTVGMHDQLFLFHLMLSAAGLGEVTFQQEDGYTIAELIFY